MRTSKAFTLVELLVVIAIIGLLVSIMLPTLVQAMWHARRSACTGNLKGAVNGLTQYASQYTGVLPSRGFGPSTNGFDVIGWDLTLEKDVADSNSRNLFLAVRMRDVPPGILNCPNTKAAPADTSGPGGQHYDFNVGNGMNYEDKLSYSYHLQFIDRSATAKGYPLSLGSVTQMAVLADRNPFLEYPGAAAGSGCRANFVPPPAGVPRSRTNSPNHGGKGQNVAFLDGHVTWYDAPTAGPQKDNIYTAWFNGREDGDLVPLSLPAGELDCLLVP